MTTKKLLNGMELALVRNDESVMDTAIDSGLQVRDALRAAMRRELGVND